MTELVETTELETFSPDEPEYYQQLLLYIQQGLRLYEIEDTFTVYFRKPDTDNCIQEMILSSDSDNWYELIYYNYDEEKDWYTFFGTYESVLFNDSSFAEAKHSTLQDEVISETEFVAEVSAELPINSEVRFDGPAGPFTYEHQIKGRYGGDPLSYLEKHQYMHIDKRRKVEINIYLPQISIHTQEMSEEQITQSNQLIRDTFFYGYYPHGDVLDISQIHNTQIDRTYKITKHDELCFSMRIFEYNDYRYANHPNEWETALTINCQTGERMNLDDALLMYLGKQFTIKDLLDTGAFHCLWFWHDGAGEDDMELEQQWIRQIMESDSIDVDKEFYLTEQGIGLITNQGRYYVCIEADFDELRAALR